MNKNYLPNWSEQDIVYLKEHYGIASIVELARTLDKQPSEVQVMISLLGLKNGLIQGDSPNQRLKLSILQLLQDHKRYLPNGWLVGLAMSQGMVRSLTAQINNGETWIEEIEEEVNDVLEAIVQLYELTPLLTTDDMLKGKDHGQAYRITGREFVPSSKWITYYVTYLYGGEDIPEEYDDYWDDDNDEDDDRMEIILHKN